MLTFFAEWGDGAPAGIDALNPVEVMAGMDVGEIHRRHPNLLQVGGIDVSHLLVFGSPAESNDPPAEPGVAPQRGLFATESQNLRTRASVRCAAVLIGATTFRKGDSGRS